MAEEIDKAAVTATPVDSLLNSGARDRVTWEDVQAVYPDIPLEELQQQLADYGVTLDDLSFEVVTEGSWARWSNEQQKSLRCETPDFWPFSQGGILMVVGQGAGGREPFGWGRKTGKWFVGSEAFDTYAEAKALSDRVKAAPPVGYGDKSDYDHLFRA